MTIILIKYKIYLESLITRSPGSPAGSAKDKKEETVMLYELARSAAPRLPVAVREDPRLDYGFIADLREFISRRLDRIDPFRESEEYRREQERASCLYEELREMLTEDGRRLLLAYSEAAAAARCLETEILAERAFLDGMRLMVMAMEINPARE